MAILGGDTFGLPISQVQSKDLGVTFGSSAWMLPRPEFALSAAEISALGVSTPVGESPAPHKSRSTRWPNPLLELQFDTGETFGYSVEQVVAGKPFRDLALRQNNTHAGISAELLQEYSREHPRPLHGAPPSRPPIRHVALIYGTGLPTDGYSRYLGTPGSNISSLISRVYMNGDGSVAAASLDWAETWHLGVRY